MYQELASKGWKGWGEIDQTGPDLLAFEVTRLVVRKRFLFQSYVCYTWDGGTQDGVKGSAEGQTGCMHTGKGTEKEKGVAERSKGGTGTMLSTLKKSAKLAAQSTTSSTGQSHIKGSKPKHHLTELLGIQGCYQFTFQYWMDMKSQYKLPQQETTVHYTQTISKSGKRTEQDTKADKSYGLASI